MIFDDLQKLLLFQQHLTVGDECNVCKKRFYSRADYSQHIVSCKSVSESLKCHRCGKEFGNKQIFKLHLQLHALSESTTKVSEAQKETETVSSNVKETLSSLQREDANKNELSTDPTNNNASQFQRPPSDNIQEIAKTLVTNDECMLPYNFKFFETPKKPAGRVPRNTRAKPKQASKRVGMTKVKIEDCLRCDDCSCIYIDDKDYYKHMRNFHKLDMNNLPIPQPKSKRKCKSCCKQCRGVNCTSALKRPRVTQSASNLIFKINMRDNIKNRWSRMVSQQLGECPTTDVGSVPAEEMDIKPDLDTLIKPDPDPGVDLSHLLSQVEVKIKTEPEDDYFM